MSAVCPSPFGSSEPYVFVHPTDPDIAAVKHWAALRGASVVISRVVPPGQRLMAPSGIPDLSSPTGPIRINPTDG
jgi:hypothetical protein